MKKITLSWLHLALAIITLYYCITPLQGSFPRADSNIHMIPYRLVPVADGCLEIEFLSPITLSWMPDVQEEEVLEILRARISYELAVPFERNKVFVIDDSRYFVIQVPYDGSSWEFGRGI
tara:strand:+ start:378 stop:737 length:360 start_codon:yes stop_codon:yes gene_type:complete